MARARAVHRDNTATFRDLAIDEGIFADHWEYILLRRLKPTSDPGYVTVGKFMRLCQLFKDMADQLVVTAILNTGQIEEVLALDERVEEAEW